MRWRLFLCVTIFGFAMHSATLAFATDDIAALSEIELKNLIDELQQSPPPALKAQNKKELGPAGTTPAQNLLQQAAIDKKNNDEKNRPMDNFTKSIVATDANNNTPLSPLEQNYSTRARQTIKQFGYDMFRPSDNNRTVLAAARDDFILGAGDQLTITWRGQKNDSRDYTVDNEGRVLIDDLRPIPASGRTLRDVTRDIESEARARFLDTQIFISLAKIRQIGVQVLGEVPEPGRRELTAYATVMDALNAAGGVKKTGSLRQISLQRTNGWNRKIDLYHLLLTGTAETDLQLKDGDRLLIPPIGNTLAISGPVKRSGIFELPENSQRLTLEQALYLAGETTVPAGMQFSQSMINRAGQEQVNGLNDVNGAVLGDGFIVLAARSDAGPSGAVQLSGHVRAPGQFALDSKPTLQALLGDGGVAQDNVYPLLGVIERHDKTKLAQQTIPFAPDAVVIGRTDKSLREGDKVTLFSMDDVRRFITGDKKATANGRDKQSIFGQPVPERDDEATPQSDIGKLMQQQNVQLRGAVYNPGTYPVAGDVGLDTLLAAAGGVKNNADLTAVEIIKASNGGNINAMRDVIDLNTIEPASIKIPIGASVRINPKTQMLESKGVVIEGEVKRPGTYDIMRGETLSSLFERAGGMTEQAYPTGIIVARETARRREMELYRRAADELEQSMARALSQEKSPNDEKLNNARQLVNQLRNAPAVGRVTVETDPDVLRARPELDTLLEPGDRIVVPKRSLNVTVAGEVYAPATLKFTPEKTASDYLRESGGFTRLADDSRTFVVLPDGSAQPLRVSAWNHEAVQVPPGSTIIVPRDPDPVTFMQATSQIGSIFSQLAISTAAIASINDNND